MVIFHSVLFCLNLYQRVYLLNLLFTWFLKPQFWLQGVHHLVGDFPILSMGKIIISNGKIRASFRLVHGFNVANGNSHEGMLNDTYILSIDYGVCNLSFTVI